MYDADSPYIIARAKAARQTFSARKLKPRAFERSAVAVVAVRNNSPLTVRENTRASPHRCRANDVRTRAALTVLIVVVVVGERLMGRFDDTSRLHDELTEATCYLF